MKTQVVAAREGIAWDVSHPHSPAPATTHTDRKEGEGGIPGMSQALPGY